MTAEQFGKAVVASGLLTADELRALWAELPAAERPKDGASFASRLVKRERLSEFQASELLSGGATPLLLGDYVLLSKIGAGGMGQVFKAQHRVMERLVAVKLLPSALTKDDSAVKRFHREVKAAAKLTHPNIVAALDARAEKGVHYLVMEYVEGRDLSAVIKERGPLPVDEAVDYILQAARGLAYAHGEGVVHRDIKPANLLLDKKGVVKILDMGLARFDASADAADHQLTNTGQVMGTVDYMAPEQAASTHDADARSDVYSLGCSLYRLLTGENVFHGETVVKKILAHINDPVPSMCVKRADVPAEIDRIFQKMVAKKPADRYQQAAQLVTDLDAWKSPRSEGASSPSLPADAQLSSFLHSLNQPKGTPATAAQPSVQTAAKTEQTVAYAGQEVETDPKSEVIASRPVPSTKSAPKPQRGGRRSQPPWKNPKVLIAGAAGFLFLLLGVILVIKNDKGETVAEVKVPAGNIVEVKPPAGGSVQVISDDALPAAQPVLPITPPSVADAALSFDGQTGEIVIPHLRRDGGPFTLECRVQNAGAKIMPIVRVNGLAPIQLHLADRRPHGAERNADDEIGRNLVGPVLPTNQWTHLAYVVDDGEARLFVDGKLVKSRAGPFITAATARFDGAWIGSESLGGFAARYEGKIDELRVSSTARYLGDFIPSGRFEPDADTLALYHFDEGSGDVLRDSSGNGHHGKINGAKWARADGGAGASPSSTALSNFALRLDPKQMVTLPIETAGLSSHEAQTLEFWTRPDRNDFPNYVHLVIMGRYRLANDLRGRYWLGSDKKGGWTAGLAISNGSDATPPTPLPIDRMSHIAMTVEEGRRIQFFADGKFVGKREIASGLPPEPLTHLWLGNLFYDFAGEIDEVRLSRSVRYTGAFMPQRRFEPDADTVALYHFDEGAGDVLLDSSGNGHDGKISDAKWIRADGLPINAAPGGLAPPLAKAPFDAAQAKAYQQAWAKHLGTSVETMNSVDAKMVLIPPGEFLMGSTDEQVEAALKVADEIEVDQATKDRLQKSERPQHKVVITKPLLMSATEVTIGQFKKFAAAKGYQTEAEKAEMAAKAAPPAPNQPPPKPIQTYLNPGIVASDDLPAAFITWNDATAYCQWLSTQEKRTYRLPTEAEWEYACRAGTTTQYSFGDDYNELSKYGWHNKNAGGKSHPVGTLLPNPFGLFDMHGNLQEWCGDYFDEKWYSTSPPNDPNGPSVGSNRVIRGGIWLNHACNCRSAARLNHTPSNRPSHIGFRCVSEFDAPPTTASITPLAGTDLFDILTDDEHWQWGEPENLGTNANTSGSSSFPAVSGDGLVLVFSSGRRGGLGDSDLWMCWRARIDEPFSQPVNLGAAVNSPAYDQTPCLSADGCTLVYSTNREGDSGNLWISTRASRDKPFDAARPIEGPVNSTSSEFGPTISGDGRILIFGSSRSGNEDLYQATRDDPRGSFGKPVKLSEEVNSPLQERHPWLSADGNVLIFNTFPAITDDDNQPPAVKGTRVWIALRAETTAPFSARKPLLLPVPSDVSEQHPSLTADGRMLFYNSRRSGVGDTQHLWVTRRVPKQRTAERTPPSAPPPIAKAPFDAAQAKAHQTAWGRHLGIQIETTDGVGAKLILIPPGEFLMGSTDEQVEAALKVADEINADQRAKDRIQNAERPQHRAVITQPFLLGKTEVTMGQFKQFVDATNYRTEAEQWGFGDSLETVLTDSITDAQKQCNWRAPGYAVTDESPVAQITWNDAVAYCNWLSAREKVTYRLPTEAEWEYACRAGTVTQYSFGDNEAMLNEYGWHNKNAGRKANPVGMKSPNAFRLHDLHGNLQEWCQDFYHETWYRNASLDNSTGPGAGSDRVIRGGYWSITASQCRSAYRGHSLPSNRNSSHGFRVVREANIPRIPILP